MITVDQLRADYLERFGGQLSGGLARLVRGGALFTDAYHDHATTETAPGHAAILSGRFPRSTGIVRNIPGVQDPGAPMLEAEGLGASPLRFRGTTLVDWLKKKDSRSRVLSVSYKDRGAILPVGRAKADVYWYAPGPGRFTTSRYYRDTLPTWVRRFNEQRLPARYAGRAWTPLLADSAYREADSVFAESRGIEVAFPHALAPDTARALALFPGTPWMDEVTLNFALAGLRELKLGSGPRTDVLAISLSATDLIGHRFGPDSKEVHDQVLRVDRALGAFLDTLFTLRDSSRVVIALTADHGVAPIPELHFATQASGVGRINLGDIVARYAASLTAKGVASRAFGFEYGILYIDRAAFGRAKVNADSVVGAFAVDVRGQQGVLRVDRVSDLTRADTARDAVARRWLHSLLPDLPVAAVVTLEPYVYWGSGSIATHGTPHDYDAHVPVLFYGAPFRLGRYSEFTRVVDIAPTLARVIGVSPSETIDGRALTQALK